MLNTVKVPEQFAPLFEKAQEYVGRYFREKKEDPSKGTIDIFGERYILVRSASLSVEFFETIAKLYEKEGEEEAQNIARQFLFDIAHAIGRQDAANFHKKMELKNPIEMLSAGPVHFSHTGWAFVDIFPESRPSPDENFYLIYDHPYAFESAAWLDSGKKSDFPVCVMNAGYSSGWCEESFGISLVATEIMCQAKGDPACRFIMAPPSRIEGHIADYMKREPELAKRITRYEVPGFFKRKGIEEALRESEEKFRLIAETIDGAFWMADVPIERMFYISPAYEHIWGRSCDSLYENPRSFIEALHPEDMERVLGDLDVQKTGQPFDHEYRIIRPDGTIRWVWDHGYPVRGKNGNVARYVGIAQDVTERKKGEDRLKKVHEELLEKSLRLERFQKMTLGREQRIMELKGEVNELLERLGEVKRYD